MNPKSLVNSQQTTTFESTRNMAIVSVLACVFCVLSQSVNAQTARSVRCGLKEVGGVGNSIGDYGSNYGNNIPTAPIKAFAGSRPLQLVSKPIARYTEFARQRCIEGKVKLRIQFQPNGTLGAISVVKGLPYGLTEQAIQAAKRIRFEPAMKNWKPVKATRELAYNFTIY